MAVGQFVAYYRVSTNKQGIKGLGIDAQKKAVAEYLNGGQWELIGEFEEAESGRQNQRPQLRAALDLCRKRKATLIVAKLDRLSRDAGFVKKVVDDSGENGVIFCDFPKLPSDAVGKFILRQMASVAELEAGLISERTKAALAAKKARGATLGFAKLDRRGPSAKEAARVRGDKISKEAQKFAANTLPVITSIQKAGIGSLTGIAKALNDRGVATARGTRWYASSVKNVLAHQNAA